MYISLSQEKQKRKNVFFFSENNEDSIIGSNSDSDIVSNILIVY